MLVWVSVKSFILCLAQYALFLWQHNPIAIILQRQRRLGFVENYGEILIKPRLTDRVIDLFLTDYRRRKRLLAWVRSRLHHVVVFDFCTSWQDGIAVCALLESVCPGVCPSYHLLQQHNRVKNCRLGMKLANKYLYLPMDLLSPEEMAIAEPSTEPKIIQYVSMLKWASANIKDKWSSLHESLIAAKTGKCFAKGAGLRNGIAGRRSKFTIIISDTIGIFNLLVEVRGPNNEYSAERIVSLHQAKGMLDKGMLLDAIEPSRQSSDAIKYMEDGSGSTFVRKKVPPRFAAETITEPIHLDFQCGEEGSFYVTYIPKRAGMHNVSIKWQNHHVEGSPFRIKVYKASNISTKTMRGAQEKRVIYDSLSFSVDGSTEGSISGSERLTDDNTTHNSLDGLSSTGRTAAAIAKSKAYTKGRQLTVTRRRVLRRIITRNGEDIVIEEAVSPTLSRQSSATDNSDDDSRYQKHSPINVRETVSAHGQLPLTSSNLGLLNTGTHACNRLFPVEEEDREKLSSIGSSSSSGHALDTEAITDALNKFQSQSPSDSLNPKRRQYSIDVIETSADESKLNVVKIQGSVSRNRSPMPELSEVAENVENGINPDEKTDTVQVTVTEQVAEEWKECKDAEKEFGSVLDLGTWKEGDTEPVNQNKNAERNNADVTFEKINAKGGETTLMIPEKRPAYRTSSDGSLYQMRREVVSAVVTMATRAPSIDSSSEMSSSEVTSLDEDYGSNPQLKFLHSSSLQKACMYYSQKAYNNESVELSPLHSVMEVKKTKLTATKSLPIMRKPHPQDDQVNNCSINDLLKSLKQLERDTNTARVDRDKNYKPAIDKTTIIGYEDPKSNDKAIVPLPLKLPALPGSPEKQESKIRESIIPDISSIQENVRKHVKNDDKQLDNSDKNMKADIIENLSKSSKESKNKDNKTLVNILKRDNISSPGVKLENQKESPEHSRASPREPIKRQNPIQSKNSSSQESSSESDKKSKGSRGSKDKTISGCSDLKEGTTEQTEANGNVFRSISIQRSPCKDTHYTSLVHIVIPKPKVDKSTQVSHTEITTETGWGVIEGLYLLMRRMSLKVPTLPGDIDDAKQVQSDNQRNLQMGVVSDSDRELPNTARDARDGNGNAVAGAPSGNLILPSLNVEAVRQNDNIETRNRNNVDDWLERNQEIMNIQANLLEPARQLTEETVDSGFDDNPTNFNRSPRWSLPLIRQENVNPNGHPRLFRRSYNGQMVLPAKLVLSTSSQSQGNSFERREKEDDADDENENDNSVDEYNFDAEKLNLIRKRRYFSRRVESFSLSDSELETKKSSYKRNRRGWKDVLLVNRLFPRKERVKTVNVWSTEKPWDITRRRLSLIQKLPSITGAKQLSVDSTDDDLAVFTDSTEPASLNTKHQRMNLRKPHPPSSWRNVSSGSEKQLNSVSSLDDSYRGFGVSKPNRNDFLSHIDEFQNLYPADLDVNLLEKSAVDDDDSRLDVKSVSKMSMSSRSTESEGVEDEILRSYIRQKRHSWDGILDNINVGDYDFNIETVSDEERNVSNGDNNGLELSEVDKIDAISDVENILGDNESYICEFMNDASNLDLYECFDDFPLDKSGQKLTVNPQTAEENENGTEMRPIEETICFSPVQQIDVDENDAPGLVEDIDKKIRVAGPGLQSGHVGVKNSFQVWSCVSGAGSLNVSITGPRPHTVKETSVLYTGDNLYEVSYEVTQPGFYKIYVKWADECLPECPYIAEITF